MKNLVWGYARETFYCFGLNLPFLPTIIKVKHDMDCECNKVMLLVLLTSVYETRHSFNK